MEGGELYSFCLVTRAGDNVDMDTEDSRCWGILFTIIQQFFSMIKNPILGIWHTFCQG